MSAPFRSDVRLDKHCSTTGSRPTLELHQVVVQAPLSRARLRVLRKIRERDGIRYELAERSRSDREREQGGGDLHY